jgi:hypothetical protein
MKDKHADRPVRPDDVDAVLVLAAWAGEGSRLRRQRNATDLLEVR